jgi:hypothetical protein
VKKIFLLVVAVMLLMVPMMANAENTTIIPYPPLSTLNCWDQWGNWVSAGQATIVADLIGADPGGAQIGAGVITAPAGSAVVTGGSVFTMNGAKFFNFNTSGLTDPVVEVKLFNYNVANPVKNIFVFTSFIGNRFIDYVETVALNVDGSTSTTTFTPPAKTIVGNHYEQAFTYQIRPNPKDEVLRLHLGGDCFWQVDQFCVATQCVPAVPIPGSLMLLGSGILGIVGTGLRRKSV